MEANLVGLGAYLAEFGEAPGENAEVELRQVARKISALILPRQAHFPDERQAMERATYAQYRHEQKAGADQIQNRIRSFKLGEFSATLESSGLTREQALFPRGLCAEARTQITDCGLSYRGVSAC